MSEKLRIGGETNTSGSLAELEPIVIVFGSDDNYALPLAVALYSTLAHLTRGIAVHVYIIDGGISNISRRRLERAVSTNRLDLQITWVRPDTSRLRDLRCAGHFTVAAYFRLLLPDIVPDCYSRALYLDCDILVERSIEELWQMDFNGSALLAVRDFLIPAISSPGGPAKHEELGLPPNAPYLNSGILLFNLERWRKEGIGQKVFQYLNEHRDHVNLADQDGFNVTLCGDWEKLHPKWNVQSSILSYESWPDSDAKAEIGMRREDLLRDPHIVHFIGPVKPWSVNCQHPLKLQWHAYVQKLAWFARIEVGDSGDEKLAPSTFEPAKLADPTESEVTIAIPTFNRSRLLKTCLESVLAQDHPDFKVVVLDDASNDETTAVVQAFDDRRVFYKKNSRGLGALGNWYQALEHRQSPYLIILPDDDRLLPGCLRRLAASLNENPDAGFAVALVRYIDGEGRKLHSQDTGDIPAGVVAGYEYLHRVVADQQCLPHPAATLMRSSAVARVVSGRRPHSKQLFELSLYSRLAKRYDLVFLRQELAEVRIHAEQAKEDEFRQFDGLKNLALSMELADAVTCLLQSPRAENAEYRLWLTQKLEKINGEYSHWIRGIFPYLDVGPEQRNDIIAGNIESAVPVGQNLAVIDAETRIRSSLNGRMIHPFPERNASFAGFPADDAEAIGGLMRMREFGIGYLVITDAAFWWFETYPRFFSYLRSKFSCIIQNDILLIFDLKI